MGEDVAVSVTLYRKDLSFVSRHWFLGLPGLVLGEGRQQCARVCLWSCPPLARIPLCNEVMALEAGALEGRGSLGPQDWHCTWLPLPAVGASKDLGYRWGGGIQWGMRHSRPS